MTLFEEVSSFSDDKLEQEQMIREIVIKLKSEQARVAILEKERQELTEFCHKLKGQYQELFIKNQNEKKTLTEGLQGLKSKREIIDEMYKMKQERGDLEKKKVILPTEAALTTQKKNTLEDLFIRLKTTSPHHVKFLETTSVILNLLKAEQDQQAKFRDREGLLADLPTNLKSVTLQLLDASNYKVMIKGFQSKNQQALITLHDIVTALGNLGPVDRAEPEDNNAVLNAFVDSGISSVLVQQYSSS